MDEPATPPITLTLADFRRLPLPAGSSVVQPPGDYALVRMPTNVYATSTTAVELTTTVAGQVVRVRATPSQWSWNFGDGAVIGPTRDPGGPAPSLVNSHQYSTPGTYRLTMTTYYTGEFSVAGGPWRPIQGSAEVTGDAKQLTVLAGRARLHG